MQTRASWCDRCSITSRVRLRHAAARPELSSSEDAAAHATRAARALTHPRGHLLLLGVGGCGKRTIARLAAAICECDFRTLPGAVAFAEWREELKSVYECAGVEGRRVCLYVTDSQLQAAHCMEDVSSVLTAGEVPRLFSTEECSALFDRMQDHFSALGVPGVQSVMYKAFIARARRNIRVVCAFSPASDSFRAKCKQFPALVNCCTIDWYAPWPEAALTEVAKAELFDETLGATSDLAAYGEGLEIVPQVAAAVHLAVDAQAAKFRREVGRRVYTTPQSYLHLLRTFTRLAKAKRDDVHEAHKRILAGLAKLQDTRGAVSGMQEGLNALKPALEEKMERSTELMKEVEAEQAAAEGIRAGVASEEADIAARTAETEVCILSESSLLNFHHLKAAVCMPDVKIVRGNSSRLIADCCTQVMRNEAFKDVEAALPALRAAENALQALNKNDIVEVKTFPNPPALVQLTMEGVCVLLGEKPDWDTARKVRFDTWFLSSTTDLTFGMVRCLWHPLA